jgi:hypothetical protein
MRVLLIILGVIVLLLIAVGAIGYVMMKKHGPQLRERFEKTEAEANAFGAGKPDTACVDEAFVRLRRCDGLMCEVEVQGFTTFCMQAAEPTAELCKGIPKPQNIMDTVKWSLEECDRRGLPQNKPCTRLIQTVQKHCFRPPAASSP